MEAMAENLLPRGTGGGGFCQNIMGRLLKHPHLIQTPVHVPHYFIFAVETPQFFPPKKPLFEHLFLKVRFKTVL